MKRFLIVLLAAAVGGSVVFVWRDTEEDDVRRDLRAARRANAQLRERVGDLQRDLEALEDAAATQPADEAAPLADGSHFGFVRAVSSGGSPVTVDLDVAEVLTGEEARAAAVAAGELGADEALPNDYYIRNRSTRLRTLPLAPRVEVVASILLGGQVEPSPSSLTALRAFLASDEAGDRGLPVDVVVESGAVVRIAERYFP